IRFESKACVNCLGSCKVMLNVTDTTDPRNYPWCFLNWSSLEELFESTEFHDVESGVFNITCIIKVYSNLGVTLDTGYRFHCEFNHLFTLLLYFHWYECGWKCEGVECSNNIIQLFSHFLRVDEIGRAS